MENASGNIRLQSGKQDWPSPIGQWKIVNKGDWGEEFGGYWLGLNVTWGKYGIHGTLYEESIGKAASHGCIRMLNDDIEELYNIVPTGTPVVIKRRTLRGIRNRFQIFISRR